MRNVMAAAAVAAVVGAGAAAGIPAMAGAGGQEATAGPPSLQKVAARLATLERRDRTQRRQLARQRTQIATLRRRAPVPGPPGASGAQGPPGTPDGYTRAEADARFLGAGATAQNAQTLGGIPASAFGTSITYSGLAFRSESDGVGVMPADNTSCVEYPLNVTGSLYRELPVPSGARVTSVRWRLRNLNGGTISARLKLSSSWGAVTTFASGTASAADFTKITATPTDLVVDSSESVLVTEVTMGPGDQACEVTVYYSLTG